MQRSSYSERDYAFGQAMSRLRRRIGLTQAGLAELLGISRKAVSHWEVGDSYPKASHLQVLLAYAMEQRAFTPGREEEEIRTFWRAARQKVRISSSSCPGAKARCPRAYANSAWRWEALG